MTAIKTTLGQLALMERALRTVNALCFPVKTAYGLHRLTDAVEREMRFFHEREQAWIRELGEADAAGNISVTVANRPEFFRRLAELTELPVELAAWATLTLDDLQAGEDPETKQPAKFSPADLRGLGPLLVEAEVLLPSAPAPQEPALTPEG